MDYISISNANGIPFSVRRVMPGDTYGLRGQLTHDGDEPMIEFYDARHTQENTLGHFVSRYYESTLLHRRERLLHEGICLEGRVSDWVVDADSMQEVLEWVERGSHAHVAQPAVSPKP